MEDEESEPVEIDGENVSRQIRHWKNGNLAYREYWLEASRELHGVCAHWFDNGCIADEQHYDHGALQGPCRTWYRSGRMRTYVEYKDGSRHGDLRIWYPDGTIACEGTFAGDRLNGRWRKWNGNGELVTTIKYRDCKIVSEEPPRNTKPPDYPGDLGSKDFAFYFSTANMMPGGETDVIRVSACGRCEVTYCLGGFFPDPRRRVEFELSEQEQQLLRELIHDADLFRLEDGYTVDSIDGAAWHVNVRAGGKIKQIFCFNKFPDACEKLINRLVREILRPHEVEIWSAYTILTPEENREFAFLEDPEP